MGLSLAHSAYESVLPNCSNSDYPANWSSVTMGHSEGTNDQEWETAAERLGDSETGNNMQNRTSVQGLEVDTSDL